MVAWTGIEHFRMGRFDPPPPAVESEDFVVGFKLLNTNNCLPFVLFCPSFITVYTALYTPPFHPTPPPSPSKKREYRRRNSGGMEGKRGQSLLLVHEIYFFGYEKFIVIIMVIIITTSRLLHPAAQLSPFMTP